MIKNTIKYFTGISIVCFLFLIFVYNIGQTNTEAQEHEIDTLQLYQQQVPVVCGSQPSINEYMKIRGLTPKAASLGRANAEPDGQPVYMLTHYFDDAHTQVLTTVTIPGGLEVCIMYHGYDLIQIEGI